MKRSDKTTVWPNFWAFPGGKVDENEFFREAALREAKEEIGIIGNPDNITHETTLMIRSIQWTTVVYFGRIEDYDNAPAIIEPDLATDLAWFPIAELPEPMIPHHKTGLEAILTWIAYTEIDIVV
jgi:8-oxo-dGTP diphosphatase